MIEQSLAEDEKVMRSAGHNPSMGIPRPNFLLDYQTLPVDARFGEQHSVLDYFSRGSAKKYQTEKRLRVRSEHVSNQTVVSSDLTANNGRKSFDYVSWLFKNLPENIAASEKSVMLLYDHDIHFRKLIQRLGKNEEKQKKFKSLVSACKGGIILAINDHDANDDQEMHDNHDDFDLEWFNYACELCFTRNNRNRSVIIIAADALRKCGQRIMERGAVETSVDDVVRVVQSDRFKKLRNICRNLVVVFRETGALYINLDKQKGCATFGPNCDRHAQMHPSAYGRVPGKFTTMVTSVIRELCWTTLEMKSTEPDLEGALGMGVAAYNYHYDHGFMDAELDENPSPFDDFNRLRKYLLVKSPERPVRTLLMKNLQL